MQPYQDEGQEVELVEMMSFEDPIIEEEDDIREDESQSMQPPQDRRVEIDWPSRIGSCGTWLPEASSFFSVQDNPLSPTASMEMDQSAAFSCGGSIGGTSLCQVFANDQQMISGGPGQQDTRYLSQNPSWGHQSGHSTWSASFLGSKHQRDSSNGSQDFESNSIVGTELPEQVSLQQHDLLRHVKG